MTSDVKLYAKWNRDPAVYFENDGSEKGTLVSAARADFKAKLEAVDTNGDETSDAIEWSLTAGSTGSMPIVKASQKVSYATRYSSENAISFTIDIASIEGYGLLDTTFRFGGSDVGGVVNLVKFGKDGTVKLNGSSTVLCTLSAEMQTLRFVIDFDQSKLLAYNANGEEIASAKFSAPSNAGVASAAEWREMLVSTGLQTFNWYVNGNDGSNNDDGSERRYGYLIGGIRIEETNVF